MKIKLSDLQLMLFEQLERLSDPDLKGADLKEEISRTEAMTDISLQIISTASLALKVQIAVDNELSHKTVLPKMLEA